MDLSQRERTLIVECLRVCSEGDEDDIAAERAGIADRLERSVMQDAMEALVRDVRDQAVRETYQGVVTTVRTLQGLCGALATCLGNMLVLLTDTQVADEKVIYDGREALRMWHEADSAVTTLLRAADIPF